MGRMVFVNAHESYDGIYLFTARRTRIGAAASSVRMVLGPPLAIPMDEVLRPGTSLSHNSGIRWEWAER